MNTPLLIIIAVTYLIGLIVIAYVLAKMKDTPIKEKIVFLISSVLLMPIMLYMLLLYVVINIIDKHTDT